MYMWTVEEFINRNKYNDIEDKSEDFKLGFYTAVELLREELIKISGCD